MKRAAVALAVVVLLPVLYFGSVATLYFAANAGVFPTSRYWEIAQVYVEPLEWYMYDSGWPGATACEELLEWCASAGEQMWREQQPALPPNSA